MKCTCLAKLTLMLGHGFILASMQWASTEMNKVLTALYLQTCTKLCTRVVLKTPLIILYLN